MNDNFLCCGCKWESKYLALAAAFREYARMYTKSEKSLKKEIQRSQNYKYLWEKLKEK